MKLLLYTFTLCFFTQVFGMQQPQDQKCGRVTYQRRQRVYVPNPYQADPTHDIVLEIKDEMTVNYTKPDSFSAVKKSCLGCIVGIFEYLSCKNTTRDDL